MTASRTQRTLERKARRLRNRLRSATKQRDSEAEAELYRRLQPLDRFRPTFSH